MCDGFAECVDVTVGEATVCKVDRLEQRAQVKQRWQGCVHVHQPNAVPQRQVPDGVCGFLRRNDGCVNQFNVDGSGCMLLVVGMTRVRQVQRDAFLWRASLRQSGATCRRSLWSIRRNPQERFAESLWLSEEVISTFFVVFAAIGKYFVAP